MKSELVGGLRLCVTNGFTHSLTTPFSAAKGLPETMTTSHPLVVTATLSESAPVRIYDPFEDAVAKGFQVGFLDIEPDGTWMPEERAIIISSRIEGQVARRCAIAHMLGHASLEGSRTMERYRKGELPPDVLEEHVNREVSRKSITIHLLDAALSGVNDAVAIAEALGVTVRTLASRIRHMTVTEQWFLGERAAEILWPVTLAENLFTCCLGRPKLSLGWA